MPGALGRAKGSGARGAPCRTPAVAMAGAMGFNFTVVTWNVWFDPHCAEERWRQLLGLALARDPDVICLQEVTPEFTRVLEADGRIAEGYTATEPGGFTNAVGYDVAIYIRRCHTVLATTAIALPSDMERRCLAVDLVAQPPADARGKHEPCRLTVATVHLESIRYNGATRAKQLETILPQLRTGAHSRTAGGVAVLCGDFNLCGTSKENRAIAEAEGVTDCWTAARPGDDGWTQDSTVNRMLFASTDKRKRMRFDRVLVVERAEQAAACPVAVAAADVLGTEPVQPPASTWFKWKGRSRWSLNEQVWASDHFGVCTTFALGGGGLDDGRGAEAGAGDGRPGSARQCDGVSVMESV